MRLTICALSAVLLSGCSWAGYGDGSSSAYSYGASAGGGCMSAMNGYAGMQQGGYGYYQGQQGYQGYTAGGCGGAGAVGYGTANGYGMGGGTYGYGANGYGTAGAATAMAGYGTGMAGYGVNTGYIAGANNYGANASSMGLRGMQTTSGYNGATVLSNTAPYGAATGCCATSGQWTGTATNVQTVQGAPIYVPQPYPAYYGVGYNAGYAQSAGYAYGIRGASRALPFGLEFGVGTEIGVGGNIVGAKPAGVATGGTLNVSATPAISYKDAYDSAVSYNMAATYDITPSTTVLGRLGYSKANGNRIKTGTIDDGVITEDLYAQWGDLEQITLEGGIRQYVGGWNNGVSGLRPYMGATAGFTHNNDVSLAQESATLMPVGANVQPYLDAGWTPTASATLGAEMQVGPRTAIGVETGIRWRDNIGSNVITQEDRWSVPLRIRGRVSF